MTIVVFLLALGAALRVTRLLVDDSITDNLRTNLAIRAEPVLDKPFSRLANFASQALDCPWCTGVWASGLTFATGWAWGDQNWWVFGAAALTASYLIGIFSLLQYALDERIERPFWDQEHDHDED